MMAACMPVPLCQSRISPISLALADPNAPQFAEKTQAVGTSILA
jgi:hypothetical protein